MIRIINPQEPRLINKILQGMHVDPYGIKIMLPKAVNYLVRMNSVSNIAANILKQEMLSLGGDVAVARVALSGKIKKTDCLVMGNLSQILRLNQKLKVQPFGLNKLSQDLTCALENFQKDKFVINLGKCKLNLARRTHIMGVVNLTPDSFSGDGLYKSHKSGVTSHKYIVDYAKQMVRDGADILDVGGESSRPGAKPVSVKEELRRTIPVIKALSKKIRIPVSIDTYKPKVASAALDNGACLVNDITGLRDLEMVKVIAKYKAGVVIMHMKGTPRNMQNKPKYHSLVDEVISYLDKAINRAKEYGVGEDNIIIDPGIGFGKSLEHNLQILKRLGDFKALGRPILVGTSRKSFIGKILNAKPEERIFGTVSTCIFAAALGAKIFRVHDVRELKQALRVFDAITKR